MNFDKPQENKFEISPEFVEAVERSKLDAGDKVDLLLVKAGWKPTAEIDLQINIKTEEGKHAYITEDELQEILNLIRNSGLEYKFDERRLVEGKYSEGEGPGYPETVKLSTTEAMQIYIASSKEKLNDLIKVWNTNDDIAIGLALGYTRSAAEAFNDESKRIDFNEVPDTPDYEETAAFLSPVLSKDNWQKEIEEGKKRAAFIKRILPKLYEELMEREHGK